MSNIKNYKNLYAFHPGSYIEEIIEDLNITQKEYAKKLNITEKTLSKLVNGEVRLSNKIASKLSKATGISIQTWLNIQNKYDEEILKIEEQEELEKNKKIIKEIDYNYFKKLGLVKNKQRVTIEEKIENLLKIFSISSLEYFTELPVNTSYRNTSEKYDKKTIINSNIMLELGLKYANSKSLPKYDKNKFCMLLNKVKEYLINEPNYELLEKELKECGIVLVTLPNLKNAAINGAVKKLKNGSIMLLINDRNKTADIFWFSLIHEFSHILQNEYGVNLVDNTNQLDSERRADNYARNFLIDNDSYNNFIIKNSFNKDSILKFSKEIMVHPGIVVGRLQNDKYLEYHELNDLKQKIKIEYDKFQES